MATKAPYDGPGVYDQPYQLVESTTAVMNTISLLPRAAAQVRFIDGLIAALQARKTRINAGTETNEEKFGYQHTVLLADNVPMTTITNDPF